MRVEFIDPFVRAGFSALEMLIQDHPKRGDLSLREAKFTTQQVTIMTGVNGDIEGTILLGMSLPTAQGIASTMIGFPIEEMDDMAWSAISELGNIITGNAVQLLYDAGFKCDITPPSVLLGTDTQISTQVPALVVPVSTRLGNLEINVALRETSLKSVRAA